MLRKVMMTAWMLLAASMGRAEALDQNRDTGKSPTLEEIRTSVAARSVMFQSLGFRVDIQGRERIGRGGPWRQRTQVVDAVCGVDGRIKVDMLTSSTDPEANPNARDHSIAAFTPDGNRILTWSEDGKRSSGLVWKNFGIMWLVHPLSLFGLASFDPSKYLDP